MGTRVTVVAVVATVAGAAGATAGVASNAMHTRAARANHRIAQRDAPKLLAKAVLPPHATASKDDPSARAVLGGPAFSPATPALVDKHRFRRVRGADLGTVLSWFQAHTPGGSSVDTTGSGGGPGYHLDVIGFQFPPVANVLESRELAVELSEARGGGTAIRIDAEVVWFVPRPKWERVPAGVIRIKLVDRKFDQYTGKTSSSSQTITDPKQVAEIAADVNALTPAQPWVGVESCPADIGPTVEIKFSEVRGGPVVAEADADGSGCGGVEFKVRGKTEPALNGGPGLIQQLDTLLGANL